MLEPLRCNLGREGARHVKAKPQARAPRHHAGQSAGARRALSGRAQHALGGDQVSRHQDQGALYRRQWHHHRLVQARTGRCRAAARAHRARTDLRDRGLARGSRGQMRTWPVRLAPGRQSTRGGRAQRRGAARLLPQAEPLRLWRKVLHRRRGAIARLYGRRGPHACAPGALALIQFPFLDRCWAAMAFDYAKISSPKRRANVLLRTRNLKMARNAHAYVRGSTVKFYEWLEDGGRKLPAGPSVWICGDCHLGNLGPLADAEGHVDVQIRDLDQTVIGNPVHDLVRLALSLASAARGSDLPGVTTARMLEEMMTGYEGALAGRFGGQAEKNHRPKLIRDILDRAVHRKWRQLAEERIENAQPSIPLGKRFWR